MYYHLMILVLELKRRFSLRKLRQFAAKFSRVLIRLKRAQIVKVTLDEGSHRKAKCTTYALSVSFCYTSSTVHRLSRSINIHSDRVLKQKQYFFDLNASLFTDGMSGEPSEETQHDKEAWWNKDVGITRSV